MNRIRWIVIHLFIVEVGLWLTLRGWLALLGVPLMFVGLLGVIGNFARKDENGHSAP